MPTFNLPNAISSTGIVDSFVFTDGSVLEVSDAVVQAAAATLTMRASLTGSQLDAARAMMANGVAIGASMAVLANDVGENKSQASITADLVAIIGNFVSFVGSIAQIGSNNRYVRFAELSGAALTALSIAAKHYDNVANFLFHPDTRAALIAQANDHIEKFRSIENEISAQITNTAWASARTALNAVLDQFSSFSTGVNTNRSALMAAINNAISQFTLLNDSSGVVLQSQTISVAGSALQISVSGSILSNGSLTLNSDGGSAVSATSTQSGAFWTGTTLNNPAGLLSQSIVFNGPNNYSATAVLDQYGAVTFKLGGRNMFTTPPGTQFYNQGDVFKFELPTPKQLRFDSGLGVWTLSDVSDRLCSTTM